MPRRKWTEEQKAEASRKAKARIAAQQAAAPPVVAPTPAEVEQYQQPTQDNTSQLASALREAIAAAKSDEVSRDERLIEGMAESHRRLVKPENAVSPMISDLNPDGDNVPGMARPELRCKKVWQCGFPVLPKACRKDELVLINLLIDKVQEARDNHTAMPTMMVSKADGSQARVELVTKWNDVSGRLEELEINYPVKTPDMRSGLYSFQMMLMEMLGLEQPHVDVPALQARMRALETENLALRTS